MTGKTNIQVSRSTRDALASFGGKGETYDDIIVDLIKTGRYHWDRVVRVSVPIHTTKGIFYADVIVPKLKNAYVNGADFEECINAVLDDNGCEILNYEDVYGGE